jgi:hypothetical protein
LPDIPQFEETMNKCSRIAIAALLGSALSSASAFAQNGPGALNYGAASNPQTGGQPVSAQPASNATGRNAAPRRTQPNAQALGGPQALAEAIMEPVQIRKTADDPPAIAQTPTKPAIASNQGSGHVIGRSFISHVV